MKSLVQQILTLQQQDTGKDPKVSAKIADLQKQREDLRKSIHEKGMALLTPEQKAQFQTAVSQHHHHRQTGEESGKANASGGNEPMPESDK
jgi:Spy/CpxP family protein refolding chaperone